MKSRETKQKDLAALTESLAASKSAMVVSFSKVTVTKDQEFRRSLSEAGAKYEVVKNTLARIAVKGTQFEEAAEYFKGVTAIAWTENDPVVLSKAISKFMKDNADIYSFKTGVVEGKLVDFAQLNTIANLPSKDELISKLLWVLNNGAERLVTIINAVPRDLAVVIKQIGDKIPAVATAPAVEAKPETPAVEEAAPAEAAAVEEAPVAEVAADVPAVATELPTGEDTATEAGSEDTAAAPDDKAEESLEMLTEAQSPDDKAEEILETPTEAGAEEKAE